LQRFFSTLPAAASKVSRDQADSGNRHEGEFRGSNGTSVFLNAILKGLGLGGLCYYAIMLRLYEIDINIPGNDSAMYIIYVKSYY